MPQNGSNPEVPEVPGPIRHFWNLATQSSSWITRYLGFLLVIVFCLHYGSNYISPSFPDFDYLVDRVFILSAFLLLLIGAIIREDLRIRKEKYANIFDKTEAIMCQIKSINTFLIEKTQNGVGDLPQFQKIIRAEIEHILDDISDIFSMLTGTTCRTAIKVIQNEDDKIFVYSLARDRRSSQTNSSLDRKRFEEKQDPLEKNEDFHSIFYEKERFYLENDLPNKRDYKNSSFEIYGERPTSGNWFQRAFLSRVGWTLPYASTMVFPIQQREANTLNLETTGCIGFLAIDSAFRNVFKHRFDGPLGATIADALFTPLAQYVNLLATKQLHVDEPPQPQVGNHGQK
ncbi:MAG: hypothetical protein AMXMBFR74_00380 [Parvibaculum sp.]|jgi:hypothetical protein|uniref:hypothetical protein n=1 Tax=Parvibaculum sp. TaxID=2024848 RepID=UPI0035B8E535